MIELTAKTKRILIIIAAVLTLIIVIGVFIGDGSSSKDKNSGLKITTTTTTLPPANSQACVFFKPEILAAAGIIPDKNPTASKDLKRCTYEGLNGGINYLTLFFNVLQVRVMNVVGEMPAIM